MYNTTKTNPVPLQTTYEGQRALGKALKSFRKEKMKMSLRTAAKYISERTGYPFSFTTLGGIERGAGKADPDTLLLLVQAGWGDMTIGEMMNLLTDRRLVTCERSAHYKVTKSQEPIAV